MNPADLLQWLNVLLIPIAGGVLKILGYVLQLEKRVTVLETRDEDRRALDGSYRHRRSTDPKPTS